MATLLLLVVDRRLIAAALVFGCTVPYLITEPMLRVRNRYGISVVVKALVSFVTVALFGALVGRALAQQGTTHVSLRSGLLAMLLGSGTGNACFAFWLVPASWAAGRDSGNGGGRGNWRLGNYWKRIHRSLAFR